MEKEHQEQNDKQNRLIQKESDRQNKLQQTL